MIRIFSFFLFSHFLFGKVNVASFFIDAQQKLSNISTNNIQFDSVPHKPILLFPVISYAPETRLALGVSSIYFFKEKMADTSYGQLSTLYTFNNQFIFDVSVRRYGKYNKSLIIGYTTFQQFPEYFFGIGNNTPDSFQQLLNSQSLKLNLALYKHLENHWYLGGIVSMLDYFSVQPMELDKMALPINGQDGGNTIGVGLGLLYDNRDNALNATKGWYFSGNTVIHGAITGSAFNFVKSTIDVRHYRSIHPHTVIVSQFLFQSNTGEVPFWQTATLGGSYMMRGLYAGRYRDNQLIALQSELRHQLSYKWGLVAFGALGEVAHEYNSFGFNEMHITYGLGVRRKISTNGKINLRIDVARGNNATNFYINIAEAF